MRVDQYTIPENLLYNLDHYWVRTDGQVVVVGMSDYGQSTVGDVLYLDLGQEGSPTQKGQEIGSIEAGKWVGKIPAVISGHIEKVNRELESYPAAVNKDPYQKGWMYVIRPTSSEEMEKLLDALAYADFVKEQIRLEKEELFDGDNLAPA